MNIVEITLWELVALLGLAQSLWLIVYMALRSGRIKNASLALACFICLSLAFLADFGARYLSEITLYPLMQDFLWQLLPVLSVLLAIQIAMVDKFPPRNYFFILLLPLLTVVLSVGVFEATADCKKFEICDVPQMREIMAVCGILAGGIGLLCLWLQRSLLTNLVQDKVSKSDRYWAIIAFVIMNCALMCLTLASLSGFVDSGQFLLIRDILGCGLVYIASTSLFRIYPQTLKVAPKIPSEFNQEEVNLLKKLDELLSLDKVYQEPSYGRVELARELGASETTVSRIVNMHFGKSVPQLLNEKRVAEACLLLRQTAAPVSVIAGQVGFNSVPSFNRVFKESVGVSPSEYRSAS